MTLPLWFVYWIVAFLIVIAALAVAAGIQEWWAWRRENR
jgi:hypothetical protein